MALATFDVADTAVSALKEPVTFQDTAASTVGSAKALLEKAKLPLIFLILLDMLPTDAGTADTALVAEYGFKVTDGDGHP